MRDTELYGEETASCCSELTLKENDNFNLTTFDEYYNTRNKIVSDGLEPDDFDIKIIINNQAIHIRLSCVSNFVQMIVSSRELKESMGIPNMTLELITVHHLIIYIFCNVGEVLLESIRYLNQIKLLHLGKKYAIEDFTNSENMSLVNNLKIAECPTFHLVLTDVPESPLPLISERFMVMNFFTHEDSSGSVTYAEAIAKKFKSNKNSRKSSVVSNTGTISDASPVKSKTSVKIGGRLKRTLKKICKI